MDAPLEHARIKPAEMNVSLKWGDKPVVRKRSIGKRGEEGKGRKNSKMLDDFLDDDHKFDTRAKMLRIIGYVLVIFGFFILILAYLLYETRTLDLVPLFHLIGWGLFPGSIGVIFLLGAKLRSIPAEQRCKGITFVILIVFVILLSFNFLLGAVFGGRLLCEDWYPLYDPDNGVCLCDSRVLLRTDDAPIFFPEPPNENETIIIASIGDISLENSKPSLEVAKRKNADLLIINGDLTYEADPEGLKAKLLEVFGPGFPVVITVGNHDTGIFTEYQKVFQELYDDYRENVTNSDDFVSEFDTLRCQGEIGVNQFCSFKNLGFILSGLGSTCMTDEELNENLETQLISMKDSNVTWRTVFIHKNQHLLQTGDKFDEVGYFAYDTSIKLGAVMMNAHEHQYARTKQLRGVGENPEDYILASGDQVKENIDGKEVLTVGNENTFVVSNGLGGKSFRGANKEAVERPWWGALFNGDSTFIAYGAHICEYNVKNRADLAHCFFETTTGLKADEYFVVSEN